MADFTYSEENIFPYTRYNTKKKNPLKRIERLHYNQIQKSWNEINADDSIVEPEEIEELIDDDFVERTSIPGVEYPLPFEILERDDFKSANELLAQTIKLYRLKNSLPDEQEENNNTNPDNNDENNNNTNDDNNGDNQDLPSEPDEPPTDEPPYEPPYEEPYEEPPYDEGE